MGFALINALKAKGEVSYFDPEPVQPPALDSLLGDFIKEGYFRTLKEDKSKAGFVEVVNKEFNTTSKIYHTRHCPTGSRDWYRKVIINLDGKDIEAWEKEVE